MLHTKFQGHRSIGSGEEDFKVFYHIYEHGCHVVHKTWTLLLNFRSLNHWRRYRKFGLNCPSGF